jgi:hypothetical protein
MSEPCKVVKRVFTLFRGGAKMNWAAFLSFFHPMAVCIICGLWVLWILKKDYSEQTLSEENEKKRTALGK